MMNRCWTISIQFWLLTHNSKPINFMRRIFKKIILISLGWLFTLLGITGIFLPLLPTTPFLLLSVTCFYHSSPKYHDWLIKNKFLGKYIRDYRENKGIPLRAKITGLLLLNLTIATSIFLFHNYTHVVLILLLVAFGVSIFLVSRKTLHSN